MNIIPAVKITRDSLIYFVHFALWLLLSFQVVERLLPALTYGPSFGIYQESTEPGRVSLTIVDFPFHFNNVQRAWKDQTAARTGSSIYSAEHQMNVTSDWAGKQVAGTLHFGYSPTMLWLLSPLVPFSHGTAFFLFNLAGLPAIYWMTCPDRSRWGAGLILFFSALAGACFDLGQTAILTGAGLLFLAEKTREDNSESGWRDALLAAATLWALTAKPPIALTAVAVLVGLQRWRVLALAGSLTVLTTVILTPLLGDHWIRDYIFLIGSYDKIHAGPQFAWSIHTEYMANLRAILNVDMGLPDDRAGNISSLVWLITLACIAVIGLRSRMSAAGLWSLGILSYLLFCPHVTSTEVLQAAVVLSLSVSAKGMLSWREIILLLTLPLLVFIGPFPAPLLGNVRMPLFLAQTLLMAFIFLTDKHQSSRPSFNCP